MGLHCDSACGLQIGSPDVSVLTQDRCDSLVSPRDPTRVQQFCLSGVPWFPIPWDMSSNPLALRCLRSRLLRISQGGVDIDRPGRASVDPSVQC